jgi:hypothetical protein
VAGRGSRAAGGEATDFGNPRVGYTCDPEPSAEAADVAAAKAAMTTAEAATTRVRCDACGRNLLTLTWPCPLDAVPASRRSGRRLMSGTGSSSTAAARGTRTGSRQSYRCAGDVPGGVERRQLRLAYRP